MPRKKLTDADKILKYFSEVRESIQLLPTERRLGLPRQALVRMNKRSRIASEHVETIKRFLIDVLLVDWERIV